LLAIVLLIGLLGGLAMAAVAGARRNQSAFPDFLASTHPSDLSLGTALYDPPLYRSGYDHTLVSRIARLPHVSRVETVAALNNLAETSDGTPLRVPPTFEVSTDASVDGLYFNQDGVTATQGRMAHASRVDEVVVSAGVGKVLAENGIHLGGKWRLAFYTNAQASQLNTPGRGPPNPYRVINVRLVGIGVLNNAVLQDDVDVAGTSFILLSPKLTRPLLQCCAQSTFTGLVLDNARNVPSVEAELARVLPPGLPHDFFVTSVTGSKTERAVEPESLAFGAFGFITAFAVLLIATQLIGRQLRLGRVDLDVLRALGASPAMTASDGLLGILAAVAVGAILADAVAVALSGLAPIGPVRAVYPSLGIAVDWIVLGTGTAVLVVGLSAVGVGLAFRNMPHRTDPRSRRTRLRRSSPAGVAATAGLPVPAVTGIRFALEVSSGKNTEPGRSAILGAVLAVFVVVATLTFGASLHTLVSRPELYGWNWNYELSGGGGVGAVPQQQSAALLDKDPDVAGWTGVYVATLQIDGQTQPVLAGSPNAPVNPPLLSGHGLAASNQVVLGGATLAQLHKHVGDTVEISVGSAKPSRLRIVGTATMPAVGASGAGNLHPTMGTGALLSDRLLPASVRNAFQNTPTGPNVIFVRLRKGVNTKTALRSLDRIATRLTRPTNYGVAVLPAQRPAEIVNYRSMSDTPLYLGAGLAVGAVAALALTLIASVRRRRNELAILKALGLTHRQLAAVVAWQSTIAVSIGLILGAPLGIIAGRTLWDGFADEIHAVPVPTVPVQSIGLVAIGALIIANLVAAIPGIQAARTRTALLLRAQ